MIYKRQQNVNPHTNHTFYNFRSTKTKNKKRSIDKNETKLPHRFERNRQQRTGDFRPALPTHCTSARSSMSTNRCRDAVGDMHNTSCTRAMTPHKSYIIPDTLGTWLWLGRARYAGDQIFAPPVRQVVSRQLAILRLYPSDTCAVPFCICGLRFAIRGRVFSRAFPMTEVFGFVR